MGAAEQDALVQGYIAARRQLGAGLAELIRRWFAAAGSFRDADADRFVAQVLPVVLGAQRAVSSLTWAFQAAMLADITGDARPPAAVDVDSVTGTAVRGVELAEVYRRPFAEIHRQLAKGASLAEAVAAGQRRAESLAATDLQLVSTRTTGQVLADPRAPRFYRRQLTSDENCGLCVLASTQRYRRGDLMPIHPGCVPGGSAVSIPTGSGGQRGSFAWGQLEAVTRRLFDGELVKFVTAAGNQVCVTPNHPVLTENGWVPAHLLRVGDAVFGSGDRQRVVPGGPHVHQGPTLAQDVFDAARMAFPLVRMPLAAEDFHADRSQGEVEVVHTHGRFPAEGDTQGVEVVREDLLVDAHRGRLPFHAAGALGAFLPSGRSAAVGPVGGGRLRGELLASHLGGPEFPSSGTIARFDAPADQFSLENAAAYASKGLDLKRRLSGQIHADSVVDLARVRFSGHVFNLHTREGWYLANSHIVSNCDCVPVPVAGDVDRVLDPELLEAAHDAIADRFGAFDRGARAPEYRRAVLVRQHGELGPVLTVRDHEFTGPADLPASS